MVKFVELESKTDCEFACAAKLELDDWRKAQVVLRQKGYFERSMDKGGYFFFLSTDKWKNLTSGGTELNDVRINAKIMKVLKKYSKYALHNAQKDYPNEIASRTLAEHAGILKSAYHLVPLKAKHDIACGAGVRYQSASNDGIDLRAKTSGETTKNRSRRWW
jgi:hypothetical protein